MTFIDRFQDTLSFITECDDLSKKNETWTLLFNQVVVFWNEELANLPKNLKGVESDSWLKCSEKNEDTRFKFVFSSSNENAKSVVTLELNVLVGEHLVDEFLDEIGQNSAVFDIKVGDWLAEMFLEQLIHREIDKKEITTFLERFSERVNLIENQSLSHFQKRMGEVVETFKSRDRKKDEIIDNLNNLKAKGIWPKKWKSKTPGMVTLPFEQDSKIKDLNQSDIEKCKIGLLFWQDNGFCHLNVPLSSGIERFINDYIQIEEKIDFLKVELKNRRSILMEKYSNMDIPEIDSLKWEITWRENEGRIDFFIVFSMGQNGCMHTVNIADETEMLEEAWDAFSLNIITGMGRGLRKSFLEHEVLSKDTPDTPKQKLSRKL